MTSTSETGHPKIVSNFETLIASCLSYGAVYNPSKNALKIPQLQAALATAKNTLQTVKTTLAAFENTRNARELAIAPAPIKKLSTRIVNALEATDASKLTVNDAKTINRKIQGKRAGAAAPSSPTAATANGTTTTPETPKISVSQQSFDSLIDNVSKLITCVAAEPLYTPNEPDLKVIALNTALATFKTLNSAAINASIPYKNAMIARDTTLYAENTGLVPIAIEIKKYVKSVFGATSPQYKQISAIEFKKQTK